MSFNSALAEAGEFGLYQKLLCYVFLLTAIAYLSLSYWIQIFILMVPDHRCRGEDSKCGTWNATRDACPQGWDYDFSTLFPTAATENNWVCENAWRVYVVHTFYWVGSILGQLLFGCLTDRLGRKKTFCWVILLSVVSNLGTIIAPDHMTFTAARFLMALGISTISTTSFMIVMEYTGPKNRTIVLCTWAASWTSCAALLPWLAYALRNWRLLLCIPFFPASFLLCISWWVPESASWLMTKGKTAKAAALLHKVSVVNGKNLTFQDIYERLAHSTVDAQDTKVEKKESFIHSSLGLVKHPNMRKKTLVLLISWLIIHLCYNGNSLQTSHLPFNTYISFSVGAFLEIPVNMFCILSLDRFGRKWPDVICLYIGGILGIINGCLSKDAEHEIFVVAMLVRVTFAAGTNITFQYTAELFPTEIRGRGLSLQRMFGAIGSCLAPTVVFLAEIDRLLPMMVLGCLSLVAGCLIITLPETTGHQLPHTLEEGERFGAHDSFCSIFSSKHRKENQERRSNAKFGRDNLAADVPEGTQGVFILTAKEAEAKL